MWTETAAYKSVQFVHFLALNELLTTAQIAKQTHDLQYIGNVSFDWRHIFPLYILLAQTVFTLRDKNTEQPIEYAQVALLRINEGTSTTSKGTSTLDNYTLIDSLIVS